VKRKLSKMPISNIKAERQHGYNAASARTPMFLGRWARANIKEFLSIC
jgi:hypothetical protein